MALNQVTQTILQRVEEVSGLPVIVQADPAVRVATVKMARGSAPAHVVRYNPAVEATDYAVSFQCGFVLRMFLIPEADRFDLQVSLRGKSESETLLTQHLQKKGLPIPASARSQLRDQLYEGLILQLRSMPVAMRVDAWLRQEYPELIDQQKLGIARQLNENAASLRPEVRQISPVKFVNANLAMNAAFAAFWSRTWDDPLLVVPYKTSGKLAEGLALLKLWDEVPDDPTHDRQMIETWGSYLKLIGWYDVVPFA